MTPTTFPLQLQLRIDWSEQDYFGHVNNVSFFKYIQAARVNYWDQTGVTKMHKSMNIGPVLASCKCDFKSQLHFPGNIVIYTRVDFIKNTSFSLHHKIEDENGLVAAEAHDIIVMFDFNKNEKITVPAELRGQIEKLEGRIF